MYETIFRIKKYMRGGLIGDELQQQSHYSFVKKGMQHALIDKFVVASSFLRKERYAACLDTFIQRKTRYLD